jgi:hypothetical protein
MSILFGILIYVACVAFFCTLTGINRLDESESKAHWARENALMNAPASDARVSTREAHG